MRTHGIDTFKCKRCKGVFEGQEIFDTHIQAGCVRYRSSREDAAVAKLSSVEHNEEGIGIDIIKNS